jgi:hypothetical protein
MLVLRNIASQELPAMIGGGSNVDGVRILVAAGLVKATIPRPERGLNGYEQLPALVTEITGMGRSMLRCFTGS